LRQVHRRRIRQRVATIGVGGSLTRGTGVQINGAAGASGAPDDQRRGATENRARYDRNGARQPCHPEVAAAFFANGPVLSPRRSWSDRPSAAAASAHFDNSVLTGRNEAWPLVTAQWLNVVRNAGTVITSYNARRTGGGRQRQWGRPGIAQVTGAAFRSGA